MSEFTQRFDVLQHLKTKGTITDNEAHALYGINRLSAVIFDLRKNHEIETRMTIGKTRHNRTCTYAVYRYIGAKEVC